MAKTDILNREEFVQQIVTLIENLSANESNTSFAINGSWGCGKSFVLDMLEDRLNEIISEESDIGKYLVVRYNCWKYDYYEEPLIAIVATMLDVINQKTCLFSSEQATKFKGILKAIGATLWSNINGTIKDKIGVDIQEVYDVIKSGVDSGAEIYEKMHEFDVFFSFNQALSSLQNIIKELSGQYTIVILVDELDRCLPEYAIKVLERLHHLTENMTNVISIISTDKQQLQASIKRIFGFDNTEDYLKKFIQFTVPLNTGVVSQRITDKYSQYIELFDGEVFPFNKTEDSIEEFMQAVFKDIDIRTQEQIMQKVELTHRLLYKECKDYSFMCMEILLAILICFYNDTSCFDNEPINMMEFDRVFVTISCCDKPAFSDFFKDKFEDIVFRQGTSFASETRAYKLPKTAKLYGAILFTWYWMHRQNNQIVIQHTNGDVYDIIADNHKVLKKFAETIKLIK